MAKKCFHLTGYSRTHLSYLIIPDDILPHTSSVFPLLGAIIHVMVTHICVMVKYLCHSHTHSRYNSLVQTHILLLLSWWHLMYHIKILNTFQNIQITIFIIILARCSEQYHIVQKSRVTVISTHVQHRSLVYTKCVFF